MNLMFWRPGSSEILDAKYADVDRGLAWGESELAGTLVGRPLSSVTTGNGVDATFLSQNLRSEAHLYARDPREIKDMLTQNAALGHLQLPGMWDALTSPGTLPRSVVLSANRFTESNKRHLSTEDFFDDLPPLGPAASPPGGSIKAVRVYNHGACSYEALTSQSDGKGLLDEVSEAVWKTFATEVIVDEGECMDDRFPYLLSSSAVNYLDHVPRETRDLRGGFFLHANYFASLPWYAANINTIFTAHYQYTLVDGILGVNNASLSQNTEYPSIKDVPASLKKGLLNTLPTKFAEFARAKQTKNILKDENQVACDPTESHQCEGIVAPISFGIVKGAKTLETLGEESFSSSDQADLIGALTRRLKGEAPLKDWACVPDNSETGGHCEFTIPAKRMNVYPDAVELVWFDGKEVKNPAYALYVLAHFSEKDDPTTGKPIYDQEAVNELCAFDLPYVAPPREFTMASRLFTDAEYLRPEICSGLDSAGSCSFRPAPPSRAAWPALAAISLALALARRRTRSGGAPS